MKISESGRYCLVDDEGKVKMMTHMTYTVGETGLVLTEALYSSGFVCWFLNT